MSKRKIVNVKIGTESFYDLLDQITPAEVIERIKELQAGYPGRHVYFNLSPYGYDGGLDLELWERREETDKEYAKRVAEEKAAKDRAAKARATKKARALAQALETEAEERALLAKLQEKYGA